MVQHGILRAALPALLGPVFLGVALLGTSWPAEAQRHKPEVADPRSAEALQLNLLRFEGATSARIEHMKRFVADFPASPARAWVYSELHIMYEESKRFAEAFAAGESLLQLDSSDLETAYRNLKIAETMKDAARIKQAVTRCEEVGARVKALPKPSGDASSWETSQQLAGQVQTYLEYLEYVELLQSTDVRKRLALIESFQKRRPASQYGAGLNDMILALHQQLGDTPRALVMAERLAASGQSEDAMMLLAEASFQRDAEPDKVLGLATRIVQLVESKAKPESVTETDWIKKKMQFAGRAHWMIGRISMDRAAYAQADRHLRAAVSNLRSNDALTAAMLFHLGWANYQLGNLADALKFNKMCIAYRGPFRDQAAKNLEVIQAEAGRR